MAFNNGFPVTYPYYQPQYIPPAQPSQTNNNSLIWVQGEQAAKSYLISPNTTVALWDSDDQKIYLKSADASGMPSIKTLKYIIEESGQSEPTAKVEYAKQSDLDKLKERLDHLYDELEGGKS